MAGYSTMHYCSLGRRSGERLDSTYKLEAIPCRSFGPPAKATNDRRQRQHGSEDGECEEERGGEQRENVAGKV